MAQVSNPVPSGGLQAAAQPAYGASGVRAGSFLLYPSLELGIGHDDNIYSTAEQETKDQARSVRPRFMAVSQWANHAIELDAGADASYLAEESSEDVVNWFGSATGQLDLTRVTWLRTTVSANQTHEERGDPESPRTASEPVSRQTRNVELEAEHRINRLGVGVYAAYADLAYSDAVNAVNGQRLVQKDRDRGEAEVSVRISWELASGFDAYVRGTRYTRRYDRLQGYDRYDRDSDGVEAVVGGRVELGGLLYADLFAGYREQSYDEDERLPAADGATFGGVLTWNVTPLTTVRGNLRRTVDESTLGQASGYVASGLDLSLEHELRRNVLVQARAGLAANAYQGIDREDDVLTGGIKAVWLVDRRVHLELGLNHVGRDSTVDRDDYDRNRLHLNVRVQL